MGFNGLSFLTLQSLFTLDEILYNEHNYLLSQEQEFWAIIAKTEWLCQRDRNTKFFHASVSYRIDVLIELLRLKMMRALGPKSSRNISPIWTTFCLGSFPFINGSLSLFDPIWLRIPLFEWAHFLLGYKAPSLHGFHPIFFQKSWEVLGPRVYLLFQQIFTSGILPIELNKTILCLIPKKIGHISDTQFWPINGLFNTLYKIISRILGNRLCPIIQKIITPNQTGFVASEW